MTRYDPGTIPVFAGPSLPGAALAPPFARQPPAAAGDLLRLLGGPPCTLVLIDGVFDSRPAVWHKEVLVLLARGFRVIGAASMGALRAAELHPFGMIGSGAIFVAFASGRFTGDDEVAVLHAPAALGGQPLSLAQVDVRATLCAARHARVIDGPTARRLRALSAAIFYQDRSWPSVLAEAAAAGLGTSAFAAWLPNGEIALKHRDALEALALARALAPEPPETHPEPPHTVFLVRLAASLAVDLGPVKSGDQGR